MVRKLSLLVVLLGAYFSLIVPFTTYMSSKPIVEKLGYVPSVPVVKALAADQKELVGASLVMKVLMYFGGVMAKSSNEKPIPPDYPAMSRIIHGAVQLDPYNMDVYYFAQAILVWDVGRVDIANELLDYGMRYRTWDWYLPFFAGFNHSYFLKDYAKAAKYYQLAGELSGSDLFKKLAGRYMQESGQTDLAIAYLSSMEKGESNPTIRQSYRTRLAAFIEVKRIEVARDKYREMNGALPDTINQLVSKGYLSSTPIDPYGGKFCFEPNGKVSTTSKFAFAPRKVVQGAQERSGER